MHVYFVIFFFFALIDSAGPGEGAAGEGPETREDAAGLEIAGAGGAGAGPRAGPSNVSRTGRAPAGGGPEAGPSFAGAGVGGELHEDVIF